MPMFSCHFCAKQESLDVPCTCIIVLDSDYVQLPIVLPTCICISSICCLLCRKIEFRSKVSFVHVMKKSLLTYIYIYMYA